MEEGETESMCVNDAVIDRKIKAISNLHLVFEDDITQQIQFASIGVSTFTIIFSTSDNTSSIPRDPYKLKLSLTESISHHSEIVKAVNTRQGKLLLQTSGPNAALELSQITDILGVPVTAKCPIDQITSRFLLRDVATSLDPKILIDEIESNDVVVNNIRRFNRKGTSEPSESVLVTIYGNTVPSEIKLFYTVIKLEKFIDSPRQCGKCYKFNHSMKSCNKKEGLCSNCGLAHSEECTTLTPTCINCEGPHPATEKTCPSRKTEEKLLKFKCLNNLTFTEARRFFANQRKNTYAAAAQAVPPVTAPVQSISIQNIIDKAVEKAVKEVAQTLTAIYDTKLDEIKKSFESQIIILHNRISQASESHIQIPSPPSPKRKPSKPHTIDSQHEADPQNFDPSNPVQRRLEKVKNGNPKPYRKPGNKS